MGARLSAEGFATGQLPVGCREYYWRGTGPRRSEAAPTTPAGLGHQGHAQQSDRAALLSELELLVLGTAVS